MKIKKIRFSDLTDYCISVVAFGIINIPSLKILYSSELVNISLLLILFILGIFKNYNKKLKITKNKKNFLKIWTLFWILFILYAPFNSFETILIVRYFFAYLYVLGLVLFVNNKHLTVIIVLQIFWGSFVSFGHLNGFIKTNRELGQHYLTLGVPISASLCCLMGLIINEDKLTKLLILGVVVMFNLSALFSLQGRTPIILFGIITFISFLINSISNLSFNKQTFLKLTTFISVIVFLIEIVPNFLGENQYLQTRFEGLFYETDSEPRLILYSKALEAFFVNPFGYGMAGYIPTVGFYPHNIFLEVALSTGLIGLILLFMLLKILITEFIKNTVSSIGIRLSISSLTLYLFLTWNISFDLGSSYIPFGALAILIAINDQEKNRNYNFYQFESLPQKNKILKI